MTRYRVGGERERRIVLTLFVAGLLAGGCDISHVVGSVNASGSSGYGARAGVGGSGGVVFYNADAGYPGDVMPLTLTESWTGSSTYQFASGSSAVKLSFATDPTGMVVGTVTFGIGGPPPPATDPNATYPPGPAQVLPNTVVEGFPYRIAGGTLAGAQLKFSIWEGEVWSGWCVLQTAFPNQSSCLPPGGFYQDATGCFIQNGATGASTPIGCSRVELCNRDVCVCNDGSCVWSVAGLVGFDLALSGTTAVGSASPINGNARTVGLTKDP